MVTELVIPQSLSDWRTFGATVRGVTPLLMHNPAAMRSGAEGPKRKGNPTPEEDAEAGLYRMLTGELFIKADAVRESMKGAAAGIKMAGRRTLKPILSAALMEHPDHRVFFLQRDGVVLTTYDEIDTRRAVIQRQGIQRSRPLIALPWQFDAYFTYDASILRDAEIIAQALIEAGQVKGLLDYRPEKGGTFGRFEVTRAWTE